MPEVWREESSHTERNLTLGNYILDYRQGAESRAGAAGFLHPRCGRQAAHIREVDGMKKKIPAELDRIADVVLAYRPKPKSKAAKKRTRKAKRDTAKNN